jgi:hypothetical protein
MQGDLNAVWRVSWPEISTFTADAIVVAVEGLGPSATQATHTPALRERDPARHDERFLDSEIVAIYW